MWNKNQNVRLLPVFLPNVIHLIPATTVDTTIYVSFRTISNDEDRYARNPLPNNFDFDDAWQPIQSIQTEYAFLSYNSASISIDIPATGKECQRFYQVSTC